MVGTAVAGLSICAAAGPQSNEYQEPHRPQVHFSPPAHWMNDPNGMVVLNGKYHLFYQFYPGGLTWGPMHWGHAISADLVHWNNLPVALYPDVHGMIFSGSAVVDSRNSSGLGSDARPPLVALYTNHDPEAEKLGRRDVETQNLAYSLDEGRTWKKYEGNPVLPNSGSKDFRDPKVMWLESRRRWIMTLAVGDHVSFFSSIDLKHWEHESDFGAGWGAHGGVWECPDLFPIAAAGERNPKYVLLVSINPGGPNGGSGTQYFVGDFDGHAFTADTLSHAAASDPAKDDDARAARWVDYGPDDYAGVTWSGVPVQDGRTLFIGWMSNWQYAQKVPTSPWRSAMTVPRELTLHGSAARGWELRSKPVAELSRLRVQKHELRPRQFKGVLDLTKGMSLSSGAFELVLRLQLPEQMSVQLELSNQNHERVRLRIDGSLGRYELDRTNAGNVGFDPAFAAAAFAPMRTRGGLLEVHAVIDRSSAEWFINDGATVLTNLQFPSQPLARVALRSEGSVRLVAAEIYELKTIWESQ